ncbi:hypothetical protein ANTQUA_LOCUS7585 [Anthophora quadrimaculata]
MARELNVKRQRDTLDVVWKRSAIERGRAMIIYRGTLVVLSLEKFMTAYVLHTPIHIIGSVRGTQQSARTVHAINSRCVRALSSNRHEKPNRKCHKMDKFVRTGELL